MPFLERHSGFPEYPTQYEDICVIKTLESLISQAGAYPYVAPESIYEMREAQVRNGWRFHEAKVKAARRAYDKSRKNGFIPHFLRNDLNTPFTSRYTTYAADKHVITDLVLPALEAEDPQVMELLSHFQFHFLRLDFSQIKTIALSGTPLGLTVGFLPGYRWFPHFFHLGRIQGISGLFDLSDKDPVRSYLDHLIRSGEIADLCESTNKKVEGWNCLTLESR